MLIFNKLSSLPEKDNFIGEIIRQVLQPKENTLIELEHLFVVVYDATHVMDEFEAQAQSYRHKWFNIPYRNNIIKGRKDVTIVTPVKTILKGWLCWAWLMVRMFVTF